MLAFPTLLLVVLGLVPGTAQPDDDLGGRSFVELYVPVTCLLAAIMAGAMAMPGVVATYREQRILRRVATTPARAGHVLGAQLLLHGAAVAVSVVLVLLYGRLVLGVPLPPQLAGWVLAYLLALAAVLAVGGLVAGTAPSVRIATAIGTAVFFPLMFTAGVWFPVSGMGGLLRDVVAATPLGAAALALEQAQAGVWPDAVHLLVVAAWAVGLGALAVRCFRWQ